jgi:hypothetical protein
MGFLDRFRKPHGEPSQDEPVVPEVTPVVTPEIQAEWDAMSPEEQAAWNGLSAALGDRRVSELTPEEQQIARQKIAADVELARAFGLDSADEATIEAYLRRREEMKPRWDSLLADLERLKQLKRDGDLDAARVLALDLVDRAEGLAREEATVKDGVIFAPAPAWGYTKEAAIVLRKLKDYDAEVAILERYEKAARGASNEYTVGDELIDDRLPKARALRDKARKAH